jgi:hypothetical protein
MEPDLTTLTLSSKPVINPPKAVFGHPSLLSVPPAPPPQEDGDEMDWAPTDPVTYAAFQMGKQRPEALSDDGDWIRPQRFFAPEQPTGLEGLFEKTKLMDEPLTDNWSFVRDKVLSHLQFWWRIYVLSCIPIVLGVAYRGGWLGRIASGV